MPRFVILEHDHPHLHWDLMLEVRGSLKTWRLASPPAVSGQITHATPLSDHRSAYLDYEGPLSGDRGQVSKWDAGTYELISGNERSAFRVDLHGSRIHGIGVMAQTAFGWTFQLE